MQNNQHQRQQPEFYSIEGSSVTLFTDQNCRVQKIYVQAQCDSEGNAVEYVLTAMNINWTMLQATYVRVVVLN